MNCKNCPFYEESNYYGTKEDYDKCLFPRKKIGTPYDYGNYIGCGRSKRQIEEQRNKSESEA